MTAQLEIPPEIMDAAKRAFNAAAAEASSTAHANSVCLQAAVDVLAPHLFAVWAERLMDEGRIAAVQRARALQRGRATPVDAVTLGDELIRAALSSVNGKDGPG